MDNNGFGAFVEELYNYIWVEHKDAREICKTDFAYQVDQSDLMAQLSQ